MDDSRWERLLEMARKEKDQFFASRRQSPLSLQGRRAFQGLAYWPPDPDYCFELELHDHEDRKVIEVADTSGRQRNLWRWGEFRFELAGRQRALRAHKAGAGEERLFVPSRDRTSGKESYGAGRYLDLGPARHLTSEGKCVVDFNEAYNPWCAYSEDYACSFDPPENWLRVPVRAGEENYSLKSREGGR